MNQEAETAPASPENAPPLRIRRGRIGLNVTVQVVLGIALFVMVNVIGHRKFTQWDYTYDRVFSLADTTVKFIEQVKEPVKVSVLTARENAQSDGILERDLAPLLDQYRRRMDGRLTVEFIDILRDVDAFEDFKNRLYKMGSRLTIGAGGVFVYGERPHRSDTGQEAYFNRWMPAESFYVMDEQKKVAIAFRGETLLNTAIGAVTNPERPRMAIVTDISAIRRKGQEGSMGDVFMDICSAQNIELEGWRMMEFPDDVSRYKSLVLASTIMFGAQQDQLLTKFFETPGNSLMVLLDPENESPEFNKWLQRYGIQVQNDRVLAARDTQTGPDKQFIVDARFLENSPITGTLVNQVTYLPNQTRSLKFLTGTEKQRAEKIQITPLLSPTEAFWGEINFNEKLPRNDEGEDNGAPLYVAASLERGAASDPRVQMQSSRMIVVGNAGLVEPPPTPLNYDFVTRSLNWMLHREVTAVNDSSTDKARRKFSIPITPAQWQRVFIVTTVVLPLAALMAGLVIWSTRRH